METHQLSAMTQVFCAVFLLLFSTSLAVAQQAPDKNSQPATTKNPAQLPSGNAMPPTTPSSTPQASGKDTAQAGPAHAPTPPDYSQEAYVVEHFTQKMRFENDGTGVLETEAQAKIVSDSGGQALGHIRIG